MELTFQSLLGEGQIFVLGDNRPEASDSRIYGCINIKDVKGKANCGYSDQRTLIPSSVNQIKTNNILSTREESL